MSDGTLARRLAPTLLRLLLELRKSQLQEQVGAAPQAYFFQTRAQAEWLRLERFAERGALKPAHRRISLTLERRSGRLQCKTGRWKDAVRTLEGLTREYPRYADGLFWLARAYDQLERPKLAQEALRRAFENGYRPKGLRVHSRRDVDPAAAELVDFYQRLGFHALALMLLRDATHPQAGWQRTLSLLALGRSKEAHLTALTQLGTCPNDSYAWLSVGFVAALEGDIEVAESALRASIRNDPGNLAAKEQLYLLWAHTRSPQERRNALAYLDEHETQGGHRALGKGILLASLGQWAKSLQALPDATLGSMTVLELAGHGQCRLGKAGSGCARLQRFLSWSEISRLPLLYRCERLFSARRRLAAYSADAVRQSSP